LVKDNIKGAAADAETFGVELARRLRQQGAQEILEEIFEQIQRGI
jgi:hydroxymethylbilane synthase